MKSFKAPSARLKTRSFSSRVRSPSTRPRKQQSQKNRVALPLLHQHLSYRGRDPTVRQPSAVAVAELKRLADVLHGRGWRREGCCQRPATRHRAQRTAHTTASKSCKLMTLGLVGAAISLLLFTDNLLAFKDTISGYVSLKQPWTTC